MSMNQDDTQARPPQPNERRATAQRPEPIFNLPFVVVALILLCCIVHAVRATLINVDSDIWLLIRFAFIPIRYTGGYEVDAYAFLSPLSYAFLHGGVAHLVVNMIWLAAFGSPFANRVGTARFLAFWAVTSLAAIGLHFILHAADSTPVIGASGVVSGLMGAAARFAFRIDRSLGRPALAGTILPVPLVFRSRSAVTFLIVWLAVNLLIGLVPGVAGSGGAIAWEAHIGGFVAGFLLVRLFDKTSNNLPVDP